MIGLQYLCEIYSITQTDLAKKLGITKQLISIWIKGTKPISKKYYEQLSEIFKGIDSKYFSKELSKLDKLEIKMKKLDSEWIEEEYEEEIIDPITGEPERDKNGEIIIKKSVYTDSGQERCMEHLQYEIYEAKILNKIEQTLSEAMYNSQTSEDYRFNDELQEGYDILGLYELFIKIIQKGKITRNTLRTVLHSVIAYQENKLEDIRQKKDKSDNDIIIEKIGGIISEEENRIREEAEYWIEMTKGLDDLFG